MLPSAINFFQATRSWFFPTNDSDRTLRLQQLADAQSAAAAKPADQRNVVDWQYLSDRLRSRKGHFCVVDPMDPTGLLYLTPREYVAYSRTALSNETSLVVVTRPGELLP